MKKEISAEKIRTCALQLFSDEGYYHTTVRQIAGKAGIALGLLYSHYAGKEALLKDLFQHGLKEIRLKMIEKSEGKKFEDQVFLTYEILLEYKAYWRLLHTARMQKTLADYLKAEIEEVNSFFIEHFRDILKARKVKNPRTEARMVWTCIDGVFAQKQMFEDFATEKTLQALSSKYA